MSSLKQNIILVSRIPKWNRNKTGGVEGGKKNAIELTEKVNKETYELETLSNHKSLITPVYSQVKV